jgi:eukaryotic-like serine/threonine-protein kinase
MDWTLDARIDIRRATRPLANSRPGDFTDLDTRTQNGACQALAASASLYAAAYLTVFLSVWGTTAVAAGRFLWPPLFDTTVTVLALVYAISVGLRCRRGTCPAVNFTRTATRFLIVSSFAIAAQIWGWERVYTEHPFTDRLNWVGMWIALYATIVVLPPRKILGASIVAALTVPAVALVSVLANGTPPDFTGSVLVALLQFGMPMLICAGIAYVVARRVFNLATDVTSARRLGSYQLGERIGAGGMGEVWVARHRLLRRPAAIKLIRPEALGGGDSGADDLALRRFEREAQATASLTSPHSIVLYDFGIANDGVFYYVMELLEGRDLDTLIRERGPLAAERVVHLLRAACNSIADAHHRGLIHRDIKPANLFTCRRGSEFDVLKVLDFGLVKDVRNDTELLTRVTNENIVNGTPGFMAPEAVTAGATIAEAADIYSLGCVAYWLLSGKLVFEAPSPLAMLVQHVKDAPPPLSTRTEVAVPPRLEAIVRDCLAKDPAARPRSAAELGERLQDVAGTLPPWTQEHARNWWRVNLPEFAGAGEAPPPMRFAARGAGS